MTKQQLLTHFGPLSRLTTVYVHWPYCTRLCPFCGFVKQKDGGHRPHKELSAALVKDLLHWSSLSSDVFGIHSLYIGGGTPSLMSADSVAALVEAAGSPRWVGMEMNPDPVQGRRERLARFSEVARVNRMSVGLQSTHDHALAYLGRTHSGAQGLRALEEALALPFEQVSADLIFGLPNQTVEEVQRDVALVASTGVRHVSAYTLTVEPGTPLSRRKGPAVCDDDQMARLADAVRDECERHGLAQYEASSFARPGWESAHNSLYWRGVSYLGIGPGAHGRVDTKDGRRIKYVNLAVPEEYIRAVDAGGPASGAAPRTVHDMTGPERTTELLVTSLRNTVHGLRDDDVRHHDPSSSIESLFRGKEGSLDWLVAQGFLQLSTQEGIGAVLKPTKKGLQFGDAITRKLIL